MRAKTVMVVAVVLILAAREVSGQAIEPIQRARFVSSDRSVSGYTLNPFRQYVDYWVGGEPRRLWLDEVQALTCFDGESRPHRSYLQPGDPGEFGVRPPQADVYTILDAKPYQFRPTVTIWFVDPDVPDGGEVYWKITVVTGQSGEMIRWDPY